MMSEVGLNVGKLYRYTMAFDPNEVYTWMKSYEQRLEDEKWAEEHPDEDKKDKKKRK